jgi:hypothetical protein
MLIKKLKGKLKNRSVGPHSMMSVVRKEALLNLPLDYGWFLLSLYFVLQKHPN